MDYSGRVGGRYGGGAQRDVDEFGRERRGRPHQRKPYERPSRGGYRGGGHGGHGRGDGGQAGQADEPQDVESRLSSLIVKVGDRNAPTLQNNLEALSVVLEKDYAAHEVTVLQTFRQCVLELPWRVTVYATLAGLLNAKSSGMGAKVVALMHAVLRRELAAGNWSAVKVLMRFFALLVGTNAISAGSLLAMLDVFLDPAAGAPPSAQSSCYVFIAMSTLLWAGRSLRDAAPAELDARLQAATQYVQRLGEATQGSNLTTVFHDAPPKGPNGLAALLDVLRAVAADGWRIDAVVAPNALFTADFAAATQHELPPLELPAGLAPGAFRTPPEYVQLVPSPAEHAVRRYVLLDLIGDTLTQLEANRKDCARYLMQVSWLCNEDVCSVMATAQHPEDVDPETALVFEYLVAEALFTHLLQLPESASREMYYASLAIELRKAEPKIMARVLETAVDGIVARAAMLDVECINRLSNWLAVYVSNFAFQWDWARWEAVVQEPEAAPRRSFVRETLLKLVRLSYLDRIKAHVPESCLALLPAKAPGHNFKFTVQAMDERTREVSVALGRCLKSKGTVDQALEILQTHYSQWTDVDDDERQALAREMLVEHVLLLGSKTFSHMLNAIEKFLPALQQFGDAPEAKLQIARTVEDFWLRNPQFCAITIDKLVNYRVIDPVTVVEMLFDSAHAGRWSDFHLWEILRNTITKVNMRVVQLQTRLKTAHAVAAVAVLIDAAEQPAAETAEHVEAILAQMEREQRDVVVVTARHFVRLLAATDGSDRAWLLGRFKEFMRTYRAQVAANAAELEGLISAAAASPDVRQVFDATLLLAA